MGSGGATYEHHVHAAYLLAMILKIEIPLVTNGKVSVVAFQTTSKGYELEDGYRLQYELKLKELYDNNQPVLIALLFHVIRNERYDFKLHENLDFLKQYLPEAEKWAAKSPENSML